MDQTSVDTGSSYQVSESQQLSERVVQAVAAADDVDPLELPPLFGAIDPDALDTLFETSIGADSPSDGEVQFGYHGYSITVTADGDVTLDDHSPPTDG